MQDAVKEEEEQRARIAALPICASCAQPIMSNGLQALGKAWHQTCFGTNSYFVIIIVYSMLLM